MKKFLLAVLLVFMAVGGAAAAMGDLYSTWRYKITIEIDTPEGIKTGSAVREVTNYRNFADWVNPDVGGRTVNVKGEAVVIDLGSRGRLFSLIGYGDDDLINAFANNMNDINDRLRFFNQLKIGQKAAIPQERWPSFVTFTDINDPKSVVLVRGWRFDPAIQKQLPVDDTQKILGPSVHIKNVMVEITDQPVTWGVVDKNLPKDFWEKYRTWINSTKITEREFIRLFRFKEGKR